jgi:hypothetical protein
VDYPISSSCLQMHHISSSSSLSPPSPTTVSVDQRYGKRGWVDVPSINVIIVVAPRVVGVVVKYLDYTKEQQQLLDKVKNISSSTVLTNDTTTGMNHTTFKSPNTATTTTINHTIMNNEFNLHMDGLQHPNLIDIMNTTTTVSTTTTTNKNISGNETLHCRLQEILNQDNSQDDTNNREQKPYYDSSMNPGYYRNLNPSYVLAH